MLRKCLVLLVLLVFAAGCDRCDDDSGTGVGSGDPDMSTGDAGDQNDGGSSDVDGGGNVNPGMDAGMPDMDPGGDCGGVDCGDDEVCFNEICYAACTDSTQCEALDVCVAGRCVADSCEGISCGAGETCREGRCTGDCTTTDDCDAGEECFDPGYCAATPCDGAVCAEGDSCFGGVCYGECSNDDDCESPEQCFNGLCSSDQCTGLACGMNQACFDGTCFDSCSDDSTCTAPEACYAGVCTDDACVGVECPAGQTCTCGEISDGGATSGTISTADETSIYRFNAEEGELLTLRTSADFEGEMVLIGPDGTVLETIPFTATEDGWVPVRAPSTGTYTVEIRPTSGTGDYDTTLVRYGLESAVDPTLFEGTAANSGFSNFYVYGESGDIIVADLLMPQVGAGSARATLERLQSDETFVAASPFETEPVTGQTAPGQPALIAANATDRSIYRVRVQHLFGTASAQVRMDRTRPQTAVGTILVDSTGTCPGYGPSIPRLASLAAFDGSTIELCDGEHLDYGTIKLGPGDAHALTGSVPTATLQVGANLISAIQVGALASPSISNLTIKAEDPDLTATQRTMIEFTGQSTNASILGLTYEAGISATSTLFGMFQPQNNLTVDGLEASGQIELGILSGDDVVLRNSSLATDPADAMSSVSIFGDRGTIEDTSIGAPGQGITAIIGIIGDQPTFQRNVVYSNQTFALGGQFSAASDAVIEDNTFNSAFAAPNTSAGRLIQLTELTNFSFRRNWIVDDSASVTSVTMQIEESSGAFENNRVRVFGRPALVIENTDTSLVSLPIGIYNNTFVVGGTPPVGSDIFTQALDINISPFDTTPAPISVVNNIFVNETPTPSANQGAVCSLRPLDVRNFNLYDSFMLPPCAGLGQMLGTNSVQGTSNLDMMMKLMTGSAAIDAGAATGAPTTDFEGEMRPKGAAHDIGADEF